MKETALSSTIVKGLAVLETLGAHSVPLSASDLAKACGFPRPTTYRLLRTLMARGYVTQDPVSENHYRLGYQLLTLSQSLLNGLELRQIAAPFLKELADKVGETVHLAVMDNCEVVYIDKVESPQTVRMVSTVGVRNPLHCTALGKAIIAHLPATQRTAILDRMSLVGRTPNTITGRAALDHHLELVRRQHYAIDNIENEEGIRCLGAPIFDHSGQVVAAVSISGPAYRMSLSRARKFSVNLRATAAKISKALGQMKPPARSIEIEP